MNGKIIEVGSEQVYTEVPEEDVLATQVYTYKADTDSLEIMETRMKEEQEVSA